MQTPVNSIFSGPLTSLLTVQFGKENIIFLKLLSHATVKKKPMT